MDAFFGPCRVEQVIGSGTTSGFVECSPNGEGGALFGDSIQTTDGATTVRYASGTILTASTPAAGDGGR